MSLKGNCNSRFMQDFVSHDETTFCYATDLKYFAVLLQICRIYTLLFILYAHI